jgi:hypothetical protein
MLLVQTRKKSKYQYLSESPFDESSEPKSVHKGSSKNHLDKIQFLVGKTYAVDLNASFKNT